LLCNEQNDGQTNSEYLFWAESDDALEVISWQNKKSCREATGFY